eukprot:24876-Chlamydomonas_euryale.AAC.1
MLPYANGCCDTPTGVAAAVVVATATAAPAAAAAVPASGLLPTYCCCCCRCWQDDCNLVLHSNSRKLSLWGSSGSASASAWEAASVLLAALIAPPSAVMVPRSGDCHASDAYFHAYAPPVRAVTSHPDWMRQLPDGLRLGE